MPRRARKSAAAKKQSPKLKKATSKRGFASVPVEGSNPSSSVDGKNAPEDEVSQIKVEKDTAVLKEELTTMEETIVTEQAVVQTAIEESKVVVFRATAKVEEPEETIINGQDDEDSDNPKEIEETDSGNATMDVEKGVEQEIVDEENGVDEDSDNDDTDDESDESGSDDEDKSGDDDEDDDDGKKEEEEEEEDTDASTNEDSDESGSDDDEEDSGKEEEEDSSAYMHAPTDGKKRKEFEIFVGRLDKKAVEDDLKEVFGQFGEIQAARIVKHPITQKSKGFAFIQYATAEQAKRALAELKGGAEVKGKPVRISASLDNDTLYMGNICKTWTKAHVLETLKRYGIEQIEEIVLPDDLKKEGNSKGFARLQFSTHADAMAAFHRLRKPDAVFGHDRSAKVSFAGSSIHPSEEAMSQVKTVYVEHLPTYWDEDTVKQHCKQYGQIDKVLLPRKLASKKHKGFGFVFFASRESAVACVEGINNAQLGVGDMKVRASLAKPQNKGWLVRRGTRGGFRVNNADEITVETSPSNVKGNAKSKVKQVEGKAYAKLKGTKRGKPSNGKPNEGQGGGPSKDRQKKELEPKAQAGGHSQNHLEKEQESKTQGGGHSKNHLKKEKQSKGVKRRDKGMDSAQPSKKARYIHNSGSLGGRLGSDSGKQKKFRFGRKKTNHMMHPAAYRDPYASRYGALATNYVDPAYVTAAGVPATSYPDPAYRAAAVSTRYYSDMAPHAGYVEISADRVRDPYAYGKRSAGGHDTQGMFGTGYRGGSALSSSYAHQYWSYSGYEAGYGYPSTAAYPPRRAYY